VPTTVTMKAASSPPLPLIAAKATELAREHFSAPIAVFPKVATFKASLSVR
jgi:hypothetical protein